jgi:hypothetical protein
LHAEQEKNTLAEPEPSSAWANRGTGRLSPRRPVPAPAGKKHENPMGSDHHGTPRIAQEISTATGFRADNVKSHAATASGLHAHREIKSCKTQLRWQLFFQVN